jgi:hypothetical protein
MQEGLKICTSQLLIGSSTPLQLHHQLHQFSTEARVKENEYINNYGQP